MTTKFLRINELYRLEFRWEGIEIKDDVATFKKAWFAGPVLKNAERINDNDYIDIDITLQNIVTQLFVAKDFYIARLKWAVVSYDNDLVILGQCSLHNNKAGSLKQLKDGYSLLIDCSKHESHRHQHQLVYPALVLNENDVVQ